MRILANENFQQAAVDALRQDGHDVLWVRTESPGISDREVLARAQLDARVVVTFDENFGKLAFRYGCAVARVTTGPATSPSLRMTGCE